MSSAGKESPAAAATAISTPIKSSLVTPKTTILLDDSKSSEMIKNPSPILYVGIIMENPETAQNSNNKSFSWGLSITKEISNNAMVVGVQPPNNGNKNGPRVKWCQITDRVPSPSIVFASTPILQKDRDENEIERSFIRKFPPPLSSTPTNNQSTSCFSPSLFAPALQPGDAIISINGNPVSSFDSLSTLATYIRQHCQHKLQIVALRHERVWVAAWNEIACSKRGNSSNHLDQRSRVSKAIGEVWKGVYKTNTARTSSNSCDYEIKRKRQPHKAQSTKKPKRLKFDQTTFDLRLQLADTRQLTNEKFLDDKGNPIPYCDNGEFHLDDGTRIRGFLNNEIEISFDTWLEKRKVAWRSNRKERHPPQPVVEICNEREEETITVQHDFWLSSGYASFHEWLSASKAKWMRSYSWHQDRKRKLELECQKEVHFPMSPPSERATAAENQAILTEFESWLDVRKKQWLISRRRRQRAMSDETKCDDEFEGTNRTSESNIPTNPNGTKLAPSPRYKNRTSLSSDAMYIDEMLEDQECIIEEQENRQPLDISWLFDAQLGAPDDTIVVIMEFLRPSDHGNLLCLNWQSNFTFKKRDILWKTLCPKHWILPRRPRKSWCVMYITKIREEEELSRKRSDDLLVKANVIIEKGDQLNKIEKLVCKAEKEFLFSVNYTSGIVLERNSLLNMAVINGRHKIAKWLIEEKNADIETCDRGEFTPLCNAAWEGNKQMVRFLLGKGSNRKKVGTGHSSQGLAPATFEGLNAEGWARKRGHLEVAELIRLGL